MYKPITTKEVKDAIRQKYAWPGGYTIVLITDDGQPMCCDCGRKEYRQIADSMRHNNHDGWAIEGISLLEGDKEHEGDTICCNCGRDIWKM